MPLKIKIVRAAPRDAYALSLLTKEYFDYAQLTHAKIRKRLQEKKFEYWLARIDGKLAGFIDVDFTPVKGLKKSGSLPLPASTKTRSRKKPTQAKILGLAVLPEFRGKGIAKKLIAKAVSRAKARNCKEIFLLVKEDNAAAQSLYGGLGFACRGVLAEKLWGKTILLYAKDV
jgi:ribosomal protein S18 acetylase RimI-like enzyme